MGPKGRCGDIEVSLFNTLVEPRLFAPPMEQCTYKTHNLHVLGTFSLMVRKYIRIALRNIVCGYNAQEGIPLFTSPLIIASKYPICES